MQSAWYKILVKWLRSASLSWADLPCSLEYMRTTLWEKVATKQGLPWNYYSLLQETKPEMLGCFTFERARRPWKKAVQVLYSGKSWRYDEGGSFVKNKLKGLLWLDRVSERLSNFEILGPQIGGNQPAGKQRCVPEVFGIVQTAFSWDTR